MGYHVCEKAYEAIHLSPAGNCTAKALICSAALLLFQPLRGSRLPVLGDGLLYQFR